jgi:hypothetical protein
MRQFRGSVTFLVFLYSFLTLLTLGGLAVFALGLTGSPVGRAVWLMPLVLLLLAWAWRVYLKIPFIISVQDGQTLEFKSFLQVVTLSPQDIVGIREGFLLPGFFEIRHTTGKLLLTTQMTDLPELMALIKKENPAVEVSG